MYDDERPEESPSTSTNISESHVEQQFEVPSCSYDLMSLSEEPEEEPLLYKV